MLTRSIVALLAACTSVLAAPLEVTSYDSYGKYASYGVYPAAVQARDVERRHEEADYGKYSSYGSYPPPSYSEYGKYPKKRSARVEARDVEADTSYGKYASYSAYPPPPPPPPPPKYGTYKRDAVFEAREAEAAAATVSENV